MYRNHTLKDLHAEFENFLVQAIKQRPHISLAPLNLRDRGLSCLPSRPVLHWTLKSYHNIFLGMVTDKRRTNILQSHFQCQVSIYYSWDLRLFLLCINTHQMIQNCSKPRRTHSYLFSQAQQVSLDQVYYVRYHRSNLFLLNKDSKTPKNK